MWPGCPWQGSWEPLEQDPSAALPGPDGRLAWAGQQAAAPASHMPRRSKRTHEHRARAGPRRSPGPGHQRNSRLVVHMRHRGSVNGRAVLHAGALSTGGLAGLSLQTGALPIFEMYRVPRSGMTRWRKRADRTGLRSRAGSVLFGCACCGRSPVAEAHLAGNIP